MGEAGLDASPAAEQPARVVTGNRAVDMLLEAGSTAEPAARPTRDERFSTSVAPHIVQPARGVASAGDSLRDGLLREMAIEAEQQGSSRGAETMSSLDSARAARADGFVESPARRPAAAPVQERGIGIGPLLDLIREYRWWLAGAVAVVATGLLGAANMRGSVWGRRPTSTGSRPTAAVRSPRTG